MTPVELQLYREFAQASCAEGQGRGGAGASPGLRASCSVRCATMTKKKKTLDSTIRSERRGSCDRNQFRHRVTSAPTVEKLVPHAMKKWGTRFTRDRGRLQVRPVTSPWVRNTAPKTVARCPRSTSSRSTSPISGHHLQDPGGEAGFRMVGRSVARTSRSTASGRAGMRKRIRWHQPRRCRNYHIVLSPTSASGMLSLSTSRLKHPVNEKFVASFLSAFVLRLSEHHGASRWDLSCLPALGRLGQEGR